MKKDFIPKEISWLAFNDRLLQEAVDPQVPLISRLRFLGIYSSNLDEFFEIRVATLKRLCQLKKKKQKELEIDPKSVLDQVQRTVVLQQKKFDHIYGRIIAQLRGKGVRLLDETELNQAQKAYALMYFNENIRPDIFPIIIHKKFRMPEMRHRAIYLAVELKCPSPLKTVYSMIEIPSEIHNRFVALPASNGQRAYILLDDVIRIGLPSIFSSLGFNAVKAYCLKLSRDAKLEMDDDISLSYISKIQSGLKNQKWGEPVRLVYDRDIPKSMFAFLLKKIKIEKNAPLMPGGRYHNFRDFRNFPDLFPAENYDLRRSIPHPMVKPNSPILSSARHRDILFHFPYHSFDYVLDILREAAIDPLVESVHITLYRVAKVSSVINALITARKNRKRVTVLLELQARYDEKNNITWAKRLKEEDIHVIFGIPGIKVHSKLCMITKSDHKGKSRDYCLIGTGNFNEDTAKIYTDHYLLTSRTRITAEVRRLFEYFENTYRMPNFEHLVVAPFSNRITMLELIENEIHAAQKGRPSGIDLKLNNLADLEIIRSLYRASKAGVKVRLLVRGMCSLIPGVAGLSENIEARGIVDRYLEHARTFFFANKGKELCFISSSDLLPRNLDSRVEVSCPIYEEDHISQLKDIFEISWKDNVKARIWDRSLKNNYYRHKGRKVRSQIEIYNYLARLKPVN